MEAVCSLSIIFAIYIGYLRSQAAVWLLLAGICHKKSPQYTASLVSKCENGTIHSSKGSMVPYRLLFEPVHEISNNVVCATSKGSDQPAHMRCLIRAFARRLNILSVKLLIEHLLVVLSLKGGCTCSSESTLVKMSHCWKLHATAQFYV